MCRLKVDVNVRLGQMPKFPLSPNDVTGKMYLCKIVSVKSVKI